MNKLNVVATIGAAAVISAMGVTYAAADDGHGATQQRVLHLTDQQTQNAEIGAPNPDSVLGLRFVGADDIFDQSRLVGHAGRSEVMVERGLAIELGRAPAHRDDCRAELAGQRHRAQQIIAAR